MTPSWADQLSPRTFCKVVPLVPACSHGVIAENMSGGTCVPTADAVTSAQRLLHVSPACRDPFHGEPASRGSTSGPYLLSSHLRPGIPASRGPASGVVSHCPAGRPGVLLPAPLRHVCLRSAGLKQFALDWCPSGHSRLLSRRILSRGVRPIPLHWCPAGSSRLASVRPLSSDFRSFNSTCCGPVPLVWFPPRCTRRGVALYLDPRGRAYSNTRAGVHDRRMETTVYASTAVDGRPQVNHFSCRHSMLPPLEANILGAAPIRITTPDEDCSFGQLREN